MSFQWLTDVGLFALLFFILVFIHELGHFLMAKWVGIKVERFAIGMGPSLFSFRKGETEYKLGILPLGGYVKMLGDDPTREFSDEEKRRGFLSKTPPQKLLVVFGGPGFNLILPIFVFGLMLATGIPTIQPVVGSLEPKMPGVEAGLKPGDKILKINGEPIKKWANVESTIEKSQGEVLQLEIERVDTASGKVEPRSIAVQPRLVAAKSKYGEDIQAYKVGIGPDFSVPEVFFEDDKSPLAQAGLQRFDRIRSINQIQITTIEQLREAFQNLKPGEVDIVVERNGKEEAKKLLIPAGKSSVEERIGFRSVELVIGNVDKTGPAGKAGLEKDDYLVSINGSVLREWEEVAKFIRASQGAAVNVKWSRKGQIMEASMKPESTVIDNPLMGKDDPLAREPMYRVGISPAKQVETSLAIERSMNPMMWFKRGISETWHMVNTTVTALYKLVTGQLSVKLLGSPIMIYKVAGNSYRMAGGGYLGWFSFLSNLALLSITLGLVNLLPVPVLDGGHATFFTIEWIRGRPISVRVMELATQVGFFILIGLFGIVIFNDFHRYGFIDSIIKIFK